MRPVTNITGKQVGIMGYGHADNIAHSGNEPGERPPPADQPRKPATADTSSPPLAALPPQWYARPELHPVLTGHDIGALYRWLTDTGVTQRQIAALTGTTQSQVADIINGRRARVMVYDVLVRTAEGLRIPRERMGLSFWGPGGTWYGPPGAYPEGVTAANTPEGVSAAMLRRHLIAWGGIIIAGVSIHQAGELKVGELIEDLGELPLVSLPSRLSPADVTRVRDMTRRLGVGDTCCVDPDMAAVAAGLATRLLDVPGPDPVRRALKVAVAELRIEAGRAAGDAGRYRHALYHYARALELASQAGDAYCQATALRLAGFTTVEDGHADDGLKMLQAAQVAAWGIPADDQRTIVVAVSGKAAAEACALANAATALARLGDHAEAARAVARGRDLWTPSPADPFGDLDRPAAQVELRRGNLDSAEALAVASLRRWESGRHYSRTLTGIIRATIHVTAGEQQGLQMAHDAITDTATLTSALAHKQLLPLAEALEDRPSTDARELARMARRVAA